MIVTVLPALHEPNAAAKMVNNLLSAVRVPPLGCEIRLTATGNDPEPGAETFRLFDLRHPALFELGDVNVAFESVRFDNDAKLLLQKEAEAMNNVIWQLVRAIN